MNTDSVERVADAILFEGYLLYPYRTSVVKNRQRSNFGVVAPPGAGAGSMQTECLVRGDPRTALTVRARFLHLVSRRVCRLDPGGGDDLPSAPALGSAARFAIEARGGSPYWREAVRRDVAVDGWTLGDLGARTRRLSFTFSATERTEPVRNAARRIVGEITRVQHALSGTLDISARHGHDGVFILRATITNTTPLDAVGDGPDDTIDERLLASLVSTHTILGVEGGEFISMFETPVALRPLAAACRNVHTWPVLAGPRDRRTTVLSSPITLYDYPEVALERPADPHRANGIDEMLSLRILTLKDVEKRVLADVDDRGRRLVRRTEALSPEEFLRMHGILHDPRRAVPS